MTTLDTLRSVLEALKHPFNPETREPAITDLTALIADMEKAEPACPSCHAPGLMYECIACSASNYPKAEPVQEPVAWLYVGKGSNPDTVRLSPPDTMPTLAAQSEKVVALVKRETTMSEDLEFMDKVLAAAPQAKPLPLTDDQIYSMYSEPSSDAEMLEFARAIEAAHGIGQKDGGRG